VDSPRRPHDAQASPAATIRCATSGVKQSVTGCDICSDTLVEVKPSFYHFGGRCALRIPARCQDPAGQFVLKMLKG